MLEKGHVIEVLEKAKKAIKNKDTVTIKELSNQTIHSASIYQDADNIALAVLLYALSKIIERTNYRDYPDWKKFERTYEESVSNAITALKQGNIEVYRDQIGNVRDAVKKISGNFKSHLEEVFKAASINKASRLYEHGLSLGKTAKILGVTIWELNSYVGQTGIADINFAYTRELKDRIMLAQEMFKK